MTAPLTPTDPTAPAPRPAVAWTLPPAAAGPGRTGFLAPDGTRIVVQLDKHDMALEGSPNHIGIGCTAWVVDANGVQIGVELPRWVHTAPIGVIARGERTIADIAQATQDEAVVKLLGRQTVLAELDAFDLAPAPTSDAVEPA